MTSHEAIQFLDNMKHEEAGRAIGKDGFYADLMGYHVQALNMAIKALEQEPKTGHWILKRTFPTKLYDEHLNEYKCSECYREIKCTESQLVNYPYCHCGAKMVEPQESEE